jgi:hypothetical protein
LLAFTGAITANKPPTFWSLYLRYDKAIKPAVDLQETDKENDSENRATFPFHSSR